MIQVQMMKQLSSKILIALIRAAFCGTIAGSFVALAPQANANSPPRILKFSGVPMSQALTIKKKFPFVFERAVTLSEVDDVVRHLMATGAFSTIEVVDRKIPSGERELVLVASILRKIQSIRIDGNQVLSTEDIQRILGAAPGQAFERKNLVNAVGELQKAYEAIGYHNAKTEIEFSLPNDNEVGITAVISEGAPLKVNEVVIDTPNPELSARLTRMARSLKDRILTEDNLSDFQKNAAEYLRDSRFLTARISRSGVSYNKDRTQAKLIYTVENPYKFEFRLTGTEYMSEGSIINELESEKVAGATSSPAPDMADRIRRLYQNAGFANAEVTFTEKTNASSWLQLIYFTVKENPRVRIKKIEIEGNVSRPESYYTQFMKSSSSDLIGSGFYNRKDIDEGTKRLITELQNQGFLRAKIQSTRAEYSKDKNSVTILLNIDEGPLTQIRQIRFDGAEAFARTQLTDLMKVKSGAALSLKDLEDSLSALKEFYRSQGYLEMKILNEGERNKIVIYNDSNTQATIELKIYEGPKVSVGSITLQGNSFTKDYVILREIAFKPGDTLTPEAIEESIFRLQRLGLFGRVSIRMLEEGTEAAVRTVAIEVVDRDPGLVTFGVGLIYEDGDRQFTFRGYLGVAYRNVAGTGRALSFRVDPKYSTDPRISYLEHRITVSYLEPYIFGDRNRGRVNVVRDLSFAEFAAGQTLIQEENAVSWLIERDLTRHAKLTYTAYSFSNQRQFDRQTYVTTKTQNIAKTGPLLELDFRDDLFNPTSGTYSFVNLEYSDPLLGSSDDADQIIQFIKTNAATTNYQRLFSKRDLVWANSVRGGYLANLGNRRGVPSQEAFFLGGRSTIRGFDTSDLERIPNKFDLGVSEYSDFKVSSDSYYFLIKSELRFPIWRNFWVGELGGAIFYDGGGVLISQPDVNIQDPYRDSAGIALRIATPVGPINLEVGWKLDRKLIKAQLPSDIREAPWAFHFSIGAF